MTSAAPATRHAPVIERSPAVSTRAALTGEAAKDHLRQSGQYESLGAALHAARYAVEKIDPGGPHSRAAEFFAANPAQQLRAWFSKDGVELASSRSTRTSEEPWSLRVHLKAAGRAGALSEVSASEVRSERGRVEMTDPVSGLCQWFENKKEGIEQGFTISRKPAGDGLLEVVMVVEGTLRAEPLIAPNAPPGNIRFVEANGREVLHYKQIKAWDAAGHPLSAQMEVRGTTVALVVADAEAEYPVTIDPLFANVEARLVEDSPAGDLFGTSVSMSGDTVLVGADRDGTAGQAAGSAYVFVRSGTNWTLQAKLIAADAAALDSFGTAVALSGDTALVGSPQDTTAAGNALGSAYVFVRSGTGWTQEAKLTAGDGAASDVFGSSVALSGNTALVGAAGDDTAAGANAGSAYVFVRSGTTWTEQAKLIAGDAAGLDVFGTSVALSGETALVGALSDDTTGGQDAGSAYVFVRNGTSWAQQAKLIAGDGAIGDNLGRSVALSGDTALVGADKDDIVGAGDSGSAYVFVRSGTNWSQQAKLTAGAEASIVDYFGISVAVSGNTALVGALQDDTPAAENSGGAYVFVRSGTNWVQQARLTPGDGVAIDRFGGSVALSGDTALAGAFLGDTVAGQAAGTAYVFVRSGTNWSQQAKLTAGVGSEFDAFGISVALNGDTALAGARNDATPAGIQAGSAYVFVRSGTSWTQQAKLTIANGAAFDAFGISVALTGNTALVGTTGSAYVFVRGGTSWSQQAKLTIANGAPSAVGMSVALSGDTAVVGASQTDTAAGQDAGSAYVFVRSGTSWSQQAELTAGGTAAFDLFGISVALNGDTALVGASQNNAAAGQKPGSAYVFARNGTNWTQQAKLTADDGAAVDDFGFAVALSGETALVGAHFDATAAANSAGSAYVFVRSGTSWTQQAKLTAADGAGADFFGASVAISGEMALIGAVGDDTAAGVGAGSAYVFVRNGMNWTQQAKLTAGVDASDSDSFGFAVALSGNEAMVGAYQDGTAAEGAGSAYIFLLGELPAIVLQPVSRTVVPGMPVTFSVTATGHGPLRYQWRKDGLEIPGASGTAYSIPAATLNDAGSYDVVVSNIGGVVTSAAAYLTVNPLSQFTRSFPGAPPPADGFVLVNLSPPGIGGGWRFVGEQQWRASGVPAGGLATGDRLIEFRPVPGYIHPLSEALGIVSGEAATVFEGTYYTTAAAGSGGMSVTLKPDSLASEIVPVETRAQWRLLGEGDSQWRDSGALRTELVPGNYLVECKPVVGRTTPPPATVLVQDGQTTLATLTYFVADAKIGTAPAVLPFETVSTGQQMPFAFVGQIRSDAGSSSGFVAKQRVVATAGHVVWDDGTLSAATGLQWLFQRDRGTYEPKPQIPRGFYIFDGYAAQRTAENTPGTSSPQSQNLDVAAMYFLEDAGRGGYGGFLASDAVSNEFLLSPAQKMLVGYPVDGISVSSQGRMHATPAANITFTQAFGRTYATSAIHSSGGNSGGPLCVQFEGGNYYPAAIYLGGTGQTVVRAIDSPVIDLFNRAEVSGNGGQNNTGGGITHTNVTTIGAPTQPGGIEVLIEPLAARTAHAGWRLSPESGYRASGQQKLGLRAGTFTLQLILLCGTYQLEEV